MSAAHGRRQGSVLAGLFGGDLARSSRRPDPRNETNDTEVNIEAIAFSNILGRGLNRTLNKESGLVTHRRYIHYDYKLR